MSTEWLQPVNFPSADLGIVQEVFDNLDGHDVLSDSQTMIEIMLRAVPVFVARGISGTTVNHLINASGVSRRTFYKYYAGKSAVLEHIYRAGGRLFVTRLDQIISRTSCVDSLVEESVGLFFEHHASIGSLILLLEEEAMRRDSPLAAMRQKIYDQVASRLKVAIADRQPSPPDTMVLYTLIWTMESASLNLMRDQRYSMDDINRVKKVVVHILKSSLTG
ncbi:TetR/AcrR family transcriptional regulator [Parendozoicomonas haliclonae]|uniref:Bacterial regulatory protein, tetR family n=1 Tax=Parendozoicomonas haliclonae TaxID=1960125 RepID=A0A1X7AEM6_9GAMM|nr:TetR/AcrR family transcriptional regulator [Parendozoicomonas haliclonae]SMA34964.1 Bacterial regulatory protein, tetR family [Parendozoicomonas haliclonae]